MKRRYFACVFAAAVAIAACTPRASNSPPPTSSPSAAIPTPTPAADWLTYHRDLIRSGAGGDGPNPASARQIWTTDRLDGAVYAEPLVVGDRVLVATQGDSVYAFEAASGRALWRTNLGTPVPASALPCTNVNPVGITSTPVVDRSSGLVYVAPFMQPGRHELVALEVADGSITFRQPIDPPGSTPAVQNQRAALTLSGGMVYVAFGGRFGDCGNYRGWVAGVPAGGGQPIFYRVPSGNRAGIWAPSGPAVDAQGNLFVVTGNSNSVSNFDHGNAVIKLSPDLRELDFFAPSEWVRLNQQDLDLGSVGPTLLEGGLVFQVGKTGTGYLLRQDHLGGIGGQVFSGRVCGAGFGGTAYAAPFIYVPCTQGIIALRVDSAPSFIIAWQGPRFRGEAPPIVAGNTLWAIDNRAGRLYALDAGTGTSIFDIDIGRAEHFATPTVSAGRLFVPADHRVIAFAS